jgi:membrane protein
LLEKFHEQHIAVFEIVAFAETLLAESGGGLIAGIGAILLFWTAIQLLGNIEEALNHIWDVHKKRPLRHMITEYFSWLFIAPLLFVVSNSVAVLVIRHAELWIGDVKFLLFIIRLIPYALFWLFFSFLYYFLPNAKVRYASALIGGMVSGTLYFLVQLGYIYFQVGVNRYGAIYGSLAALPLFLLWIQVSWFILLFGAEVSYAHQTLDKHEFEGMAKQASPNVRKILSLWMLHLIMKRFQETRKGVTLTWLIRHCRIPIALAIPTLEMLHEAGLLVEIREGPSYIPSRFTDQFRISDAIIAIESTGKSADELPFLRAKELEPFERALGIFQDLMERSSDNRLLSDL